MKHLLLVLLASCVSAHAQQNDASIAAERTRLARERAQVEAAFKAEEKACYARFGVNDCLSAAKSRRRQAVGDLRRQELALNDAERKRKAMERMRSLEQKSDAAPSAASASLPVTSAPSPDRGIRGTDRGAAAAKAAQQEKEVQLRRREAAEETQRRAEDAARRSSEQAERAAKARERQDKLRQRLAERKKPPASSLQDPR